MVHVLGGGPGKHTSKIEAPESGYIVTGKDGSPVRLQPVAERAISTPPAPSVPAQKVKQERPTAPPRPVCQCKERGEALKRAAAAKLAGDDETWTREMDFVKKSAAEDAAALKDWAIAMKDHHVGRFKRWAF
jgi:hypothetical protein